MGAGPAEIPGVAGATCGVRIRLFETGPNGTVDIGFDGNRNAEFLSNYLRRVIPESRPWFVPVFEKELWMDMGFGATSLGR